jgi:DNA-binding transcriptional regulator YiaG
MSMQRHEFNDLLEKACLSKEEFAKTVGLQYRSVNNWGTGAQNIPHWVESWLELYVENNQCKKIKAMIKEIKEE